MLHWGTGGSERWCNLPDLTQLVSGRGRIRGHPALPSTSWQNIQPSPLGVLWVSSQRFSRVNPLAFLHYPGRGCWWLPIPELTPACPGGSQVNPPTAALRSRLSSEPPLRYQGSFPSRSDAVDTGPPNRAWYHLPWVPRRSCLISASPGIQKSLKKKNKKKHTHTHKKRRTSHFWKGGMLEWRDAPAPKFTATQPRSQTGLKSHRCPLCLLETLVLRPLDGN